MDLNIFSSKDSAQLPQEKKQKVMLLVLAAVVLLSLVILYFGLWRSPGPSEEAPIDEFEPAEQETDDQPPAVDAIGMVSLENVLTKIEFDVDFLNDAEFRSLVLYGQWPLEIGQTGRSNPFVPF